MEVLCLLEMFVPTGRLHDVKACHEYCDKNFAAVEINILCGENSCIH
jgi:hypothetical protein